MPQSASLRNLWAGGGVRAGDSGLDYREGGDLGKLPAEGARAQDTLLKLQWMLGHTPWMALTSYLPGQEPASPWLS